MATQQFFKSFYIADDAAFRAWIVAFRVAVEALGLVRVTAGVGATIDAATVLAPTTYNQNRGYDVFRFDDAKAAAGKNIYIKVTYGSQNLDPYGLGESQNRLRLVFQTGTGIDNTGLLLGNVTNARDISVVTKNPGGSVSYYEGVTNTDLQAIGMQRLSGHASRLTIAFNDDAFAINPSEAQYPTAFFLANVLNIERSHDDTGAESEDGAIVQMSGFRKIQNSQVSVYNNSDLFQQYLTYDRSSRPQYTWGCFFIGDRNTTLSYASISGLPISPFEGGRMKNCGIGLMGFLDGDFDGVTQTLEIYGAVRTYRRLAPAVPHINPAIGTQQASSRLLYLWE